MNSDAWRDFPNAPEPGTVLCAARDVPQSGARGLDLKGFPVLLVASSAGLRAYVNACPHQFLPLDYRAPVRVSDDGTRLRCSVHDAGFDAETGQGIDGFGQGCALDPVPVALIDGHVVIGSTAPS